jgi:hypothetical protein
MSTSSAGSCPGGGAAGTGPAAANAPVQVKVRKEAEPNKATNCAMRRARNDSDLLLPPRGCASAARSVLLLPTSDMSAAVGRHWLCLLVSDATNARSPVPPKQVRTANARKTIAQLARRLPPLVRFRTYIHRLELDGTTVRLRPKQKGRDLRSRPLRSPPGS